MTVISLFYKTFVNFVINWTELF